MNKVESIGSVDPKLIELVQWILNYYNLSDITFTFVENPKMLEKFSTKDVELYAYLCNPSKNRYQLFFKPGYLDKTVVCHELVHLKQYQDKRLSQTLDYNFIWEGKPYDKSMSYNSRPWEIEAFKNQNKLWKEYKKATR